MAYTVSGTDLTSIANAIRTKGGTSASLEFPNDFVSAIGNISGGGGLTNVVVGTFQYDSTKKGTAQTITLGYSGSGYPIMVAIFPAVGTYNPDTDPYTRLQRYACLYYFMTKEQQTGENATPLYTGYGGKDYGFVNPRIKNSDTSATTYGSTIVINQFVYSPNAANANNGTIVRLNSATQMSVFIADASYGFMDNVEYKYVVVYSS